MSMTDDNHVVEYSWDSLSAGINDDEGDDEGAVAWLSNSLSKGAKQLQELIEEQVDTKDRLLEIVGKRISGPIDETTFSIVSSSLRAYLGDHLSGMLIWVSIVDSDSRIKQLEQYASTATMHLVRSLVGSYGQELQQAYLKFGEHPNSWMTLSGGFYSSFMWVRIDKFNNEGVFFEGSVASFLNLVTELFRGVTSIATKENVDPNDVLALADMVQGLLEEVAQNEETGEDSEIVEVDTE